MSGRRELRTSWTGLQSDSKRRLRREDAGTSQQRLGRRSRPLIAEVLALFGACLMASEAAAWAQASPRDAAAPRPAAAPAQGPGENQPPGGAPGQRSGETQPTAAASALGTADALSARYRFVERYALEDDPSQPELVTQYQVGIRESLKSVREKAQGAPERVESSFQTIYTERAAKVTNLGDVIAAVRRYDKFFQKGLIIPASDKKPFDDLTVWIQRGPPGLPPQILSLTNDRALREAEFDLMIQQISAPPLKALLPASPRRKGDTWKVPREATFFLFAALPDAEEYNLEATLSDVRKVGTGSKLVAVIGISGPVNLPDGPSLVNGEIHFAFDPPPSPAAELPGGADASSATPKSSGRATVKGSKEGIVDARGWITEVRIAWRTDYAEPEGEGRLKTIDTHEIWLVRRPLAAANQAGAQPPAPLSRPDPPPVATQANSWLVYEDPDGRFRFRHPQLLTPQSFEQMSPYEVHLADKGGGRDRLGILLRPKDASAERQLAFLDAEHFQRAISQEWTKKKMEILRGPVGFLSGTQWDESKRKVYRMEAGLKLHTETERDEGRVYIDYYLVDFGGGQTIIVESWTDRNDHVSFRNQAEAVVKSFEFSTTTPKATRANPAGAAGAISPAPRR